MEKINITKSPKEIAWGKLELVHRKVRTMAKEMDITYGIEMNKGTAIPIMSLMNDIEDSSFKEFAEKIKVMVGEINREDDIHDIIINYTEESTTNAEQIDIYVEQK